MLSQTENFLNSAKILVWPTKFQLGFFTFWRKFWWFNIVDIVKMAKEVQKIAKKCQKGTQTWRKSGEKSQFWNKKLTKINRFRHFTLAFDWNFGLVNLTSNKLFWFLVNKCLKIVKNVCENCWKLSQMQLCSLKKSFWHFFLRFDNLFGNFSWQI